MIDGINQLALNIGLTDYKTFLGTNCDTSLCAHISQLGADFGNMQTYMSDALGVGALLITADDCVVLIKRSLHVGEEKGKTDLPGGHPEPKVKTTSI